MAVMMGRRKIFFPTVFIDIELLANFTVKTTFRIARLYFAQESLKKACLRHNIGIDAD